MGYANLSCVVVIAHAADSNRCAALPHVVCIDSTSDHMAGFDVVRGSADPILSKKLPKHYPFKIQGVIKHDSRCEMDESGNGFGGSKPCQL